MQPDRALTSAGHAGSDGSAKSASTVAEEDYAFDWIAESEDISIFALPEFFGSVAAGDGTALEQPVGSVTMPNTARMATVLASMTGSALFIREMSTAGYKAGKRRSGGDDDATSSSEGEMQGSDSDYDDDKGPPILDTNTPSSATVSLH
ncbi:hypothetical protein EV182_007135 [Spiromyces aspiralis]|uniref:Uncharacterized protein n=1 Tax=Spiromyces aspiralis TaxID=68401 RepID=A0ACC1H8B3_9FUNG|nr:hypothetical protein EV182_007135 [Spiromyces aspiralis]